MKLHGSVGALGATLLSVLQLAPGAAAQQDYRFHHEGVLGTSFDLSVTAAHAAQARAAETAALAEVGRLARLLSAYHPQSEWSRLIAAGAGRASTELLEVLSACEEWRVRTDNAFHPGVALVTQTWREAVAPPADVAARAAVVRPEARAPWQLDPATGQVRLAPGAGVTLDGLAKGYIVDAVCARVVACAGVSACAVDIGGDLRVAGQRAHEVRVADPRRPADNAEPLDVLSLRDAAVASSGGYARAVVVAGETHSHIVDPRTGLPADGILGATVVAPTCCAADAAATALNVMQPTEGLALIEGLDGVECILVDCDGAVYRSEGWARLGRPVMAAADSASTVAGPGDWPTGFEVALAFEIQRPVTGRRGSYRRPYVAVWVEDADGNSVRTLCLWIEGRRWVRDLKTWYRGHRRRAELIDTVSRATRRPGEYELVWNGRDDAGVALPAGTYTVCLEVAREHGTHQLMRGVVRVAAAPTDAADRPIQLGTNVEVRRAALTLRPRGGAR